MDRPPAPINVVLTPDTLFRGRYRVVKCINAGAMGAVYEVYDEKVDGVRALKVMLPGLTRDPDLLERFRREARITGHIESDHIVRVLDADVDEGTDTPFLVMELLRGEQLGHLLERRGPLPPADVVLFLFQAALALDKAHAAGVVHRDLKPENLFITWRDDGTPCLKLLDFGIAKVIEAAPANATRALGTPLYMAPEQVRGDGSIGLAADVYALGHIAYTLLAGEAYWRGDPGADGALYLLLSRIIVGADELPTARAQRRKGQRLPPDFDRWFLQATASRPEDRFPRASAAVAALAEVLGVPVPRAPAPSYATLVLPADPGVRDRREGSAAHEASQPGDDPGRSEPRSLRERDTAATGLTGAATHAPHRGGTRGVVLKASLAAGLVAAIALAGLGVSALRAARRDAGPANAVAPMEPPAPPAGRDATPSEDAAAAVQSSAMPIPEDPAPPASAATPRIVPAVSSSPPPAPPRPADSALPETPRRDDPYTEAPATELPPPAPSRRRESLD